MNEDQLYDAAEPVPADPALVLGNGEVIAARAYSGGLILIAFAPDAPTDHAAELRAAMAAQFGVPVFAVAGVTALRTWEPHEVPELAYAQVERDDYAARLKAADQGWTKVAAERDEAREQLGRLQDSIGNLAAGLKLSADASRPSKKSQIEDGCAAALLGILDPRQPVERVKADGHYL